MSRLSIGGLDATLRDISANESDVVEYIIILMSVNSFCSDCDIRDSAVNGDRKVNEILLY